MGAAHYLAVDAAGSGRPGSPMLRSSLTICASVALISLSAALLLPKGYALAVIGDGIPAVLILAAVYLSFQNAMRSRSNVRGFWILIFLGSAMWMGSLMIWLVYELVLRRPVPAIPFGDILLFLKLVPLSAAIALQPHKSYDSRFRAFGLLDVAILIIYSLYLYAFWVFAYRLLPGAEHIYDFHFNVADAIGSQIFALVTGVALLRVRGPWRGLYLLYFLSAVACCVAADIMNVAIDIGKYYTGSVFDVPLALSLAALLACTWEGRRLQVAEREPVTGAPSDEPASHPSFLSSNFAMLVTLSTPALGLWLLSADSMAPQIFSFRLVITLLTLFLLTLLLAIKQHFLTDSLIGSLQNLSVTYTSINRYKDQLTQSEKLASLGESVAQVANQIKKAMAIIRERSHMLTARPDSESRIQSMAGKIGQYAYRTDALVENMLRFAQETSLQLAPLEIKSLIESTLQLGRTSKISNIEVSVAQTGDIPRVLGDSSQLLHVFLELISNAVDALEESGGGRLNISIAAIGSHVCIEFADSGPGIKQPEHVFEPFYTTKPVGKGTGLGLSTCYGIVQKHQGEISCRNCPEGGAVFTILLPLDLRTAADPLQVIAVVEGAR